MRLRRPNISPEDISEDAGFIDTRLLRPQAGRLLILMAADYFDDGCRRQTKLFHSYQPFRHRLLACRFAAGLTPPRRHYYARSHRRISGIVSMARSIPEHQLHDSFFPASPYVADRREYLSHSYMAEG